MSYQSALAALADPTRQAIMDRLRGSRLAVGELAEQLPVSRPAVSKHLAVLERAALVRHVRVGNRSLYSLDLRGLEELRDYVDGYWTDVLTAFADKAETEAETEVPTRHQEQP